MRKEVKTGAQLALVTTLAVAASSEVNATGRQINENFTAENSLFVDIPNDPDFQQFEPTPTPTLTVTTEPSGGRLRSYPDAGNSANIIDEVPSNTPLEVLGYLNTNSIEGNNPDYWFWAKVLGTNQMVWVNQLVIPDAIEIDQTTQTPRPKGNIPDLVNAAQIRVFQNGETLLNQDNQTVRLIEYNSEIGNTIDLSRLARVWGDSGLPMETYNPANLAVADNLGEVIVQTADIARPDGGVNPAGSVLLLPEVTLPDQSTNIQPLFLNKADIEADLGMEINFDSTNTAEGSIRLTPNALFNYGRFAQDRVSGANVNTAFYQNMVVSAEGDFPNSSFEFNAEFTRITFTTGENYELSLSDDGYWLAVRAAAAEFNLATDRYTWGEQVSARHVEGTTYELTIGGKVLRVDYPQGLPFGTESNYLISKSDFILQIVGIYLGQNVPNDPNNPNEFTEIYMALPTENGQCLVLAAGAPEFRDGFLLYIDPESSGHRTSPYYTNEQFGELVQNNVNVGDLVKIGMIDINNINLNSETVDQEYLGKFVPRYGYDSADRAEYEVRNLLNMQPGQCAFVEAGSLTGITLHPLLAPRVTSR